MLYQLKFAFRYLSAGLVQTGLLVLGVAVGVFVFVFMSALIGGLAVYLVNQTVGDIAHVTITAPERVPSRLYTPDEGAIVVIDKASSRSAVLRSADETMATLSNLPGVTAMSEQITGNGFVTHGDVIKPVAVTGVEQNKVSAIAKVAKRLVTGSADLPIGSVIIGKTLADDLGVKVGQGLRMTSDRSVDTTLTISGIFSFGLAALDERTAFVNLKTARGLFGLRNGVSRIELRLGDLWAAPDFSRRAAKATELEATPWTAGNAQLLSGLQAQARSGDIIKGFALVTIVIGVASALLLSTYRRRSEIGIMRAMGAGKGFVVGVFVLQGGLIGLFGGIAGAVLAYLALSIFPPPSEITTGQLPIDISQGGFALAVTLTLAGAVLASILPARAAASVDPVTVISQ